MSNLSHFAQTIFERTYQFNDKESWDGCAKRVAKFVANDNADDYRDFYEVISTRKFLPGGRYLYSSGREIAQLTNCFLLQPEDSREGWGDLLSVGVNALTTGGGVGAEYSKIRGAGTPIKRYGGTASGPLSLMAMVNEVARHVMAGGKRRSALWAGLVWDHPDIEAFIDAKNWSTAVKALKEKDFNFPAILDMTNISVRLNAKFFKTIKTDEALQDFYYRVCRSMCRTGEPGFSIDMGKNAGDILRNPCCEVVSDKDGDCCNLGSVNLSRIVDLQELERVTRIGTRFLYLGTYRGWLPHAKFIKVREEYRRIGLGIMGLHEWCIRNDQGYEPSGKLGEWLSTWRRISDDEADRVSMSIKGARPKGVRAIAPTGTIGIIAETTTGVEPVFCTAYKRRFLGANQKWQYSYVVDPTVARLVTEKGISPEDIEDSYSLSRDVERRISMQAFVQDFVDQAISSTINLPEWGEPGNNNAKEFSRILLKYLPRLRGVTVYPEGARSGQPIVPVRYETAVKHKDVVFQEFDDRCKEGVCGI
jgi:ribonucleoside-diphosphate reductase alpha chain